jgi:hypothetical protein
VRGQFADRFEDVVVRGFTHRILMEHTKNVRGASTRHKIPRSMKKVCVKR